jgi:outer membrane lipoprotein SlyB
MSLEAKTMQILKLGAILAIATLIAGCEGQSQTERALAGGLAGGLVGSATGNNVATSAAVGALGGMATCGIQGMPACR